MDRPVNSVAGTKRDRTRDALLVSTQALLHEYNAAELRIRQITDHAGLVHASFYNYYPDVGALISDLGNLLGAAHFVMMAPLINAGDSAPVRFARITRQTLRVAAEQCFFGRLMFDVGLPLDRLSGGLRQSLALDIMDGVSQGMFYTADIEIAVSILNGAIKGLSLDLHRGVFPAAKIDAATAQLLTALGVEPAEAEMLAFAPMDALPLPEVPLRWLALPPAFLSSLGS